MDTIVWKRVCRMHYLSQPLDSLLVERLSAHLSDTVTFEARAAFVFGCELLCASLNRGDTFLSVEPDRLRHTIAGWLALEPATDLLLKESAAHGKREPAVRLAAGDLLAWVTAQWLPFAANLKSGVYNDLVAERADHNRPLVFDRVADRLYFDRYFEAVTGVNVLFSKRIGDFPFELETDSAAALAALLTQTPTSMQPDDRQSAALLLALHNKTLIVSGGPGTGKTTVVVQVLRLFLRVLPWLTADMVRIVAPTGRAAARMQESIAKSLDEMLSGSTGADTGERHRDETLRTLTGSTVHRLLVYNPSTAGFGYSRANPLDAAVVIVDEVSMLDIELFAHLLEGLSEKCVLILLGDRFQLPSVEAGAVLGDLADGFDRATGASLSPQTVDRTKKVLARVGRVDSGDLDAATLVDSRLLRDRAVILTRSHRSIQNIQSLANAINTNDHPLDLLAAAEQRPTTETWAGIIDSNAGARNYLWINDGQAERPLTALLAGWLDYHFGSGYAALVGENRLDESGRPGVGAMALLAHIEQSRILCVLRDSVRGAVGVNRDACRYLCRTIDPRGSLERFAGLPILITRNNAVIELYNGDCGVLMRSIDDRWFGLFRRGKTLVTHPLDALPAWEPAVATTVHKSQGSEYERVLLILPGTPAPICTREIIYTAVTRAKQFAGIVGSQSVLAESLGRSIRRNTGIAVS